MICTESLVKDCIAHSDTVDFVLGLSSVQLVAAYRHVVPFRIPDLQNVARVVNKPI